MLNKLKKSAIKLSIVTTLAITPSIALGASGGGFIEGSSESTTAIIESPNFEGQLVRINTGINLIRINTDILENMPISEDSEWVDKVIASPDNNRIMNMEDVKEDAYYSTVIRTSRMLNRNAARISPLGIRLYSEAAAIYTKIPNMNKFPDISNSQTFITFEDATLINVEARNGERYDNAELATISLLPEDIQETTKEALTNYQEAKKLFLDKKSEVGKIEIWLEDEANEGSPKIGTYEEKLSIAEAEVEKSENNFDEKADIYYELLSKGADSLESNYDESKLALAKKLEKLLNTVDNNSIGAISMFGAATAGLIRGVGVIQQEVEVLGKFSDKYHNEADKAAIRLKRMAIGSVMAIPNIGIGTYYAFKQSSLAGSYQAIVEKVIEGGEAAAEAEKAAAELKEESK